MSMVWGRRLDPDNIGRLIDDAIAHDRRVRRAGRRRPVADRRPAHRPGRPAQLRRQRRFAAPPGGWPGSRRSTAAGSPPPGSIRPASTPPGSPAIPVTVKADLIRQQADFLCADAPRQLATRTTGTHRHAGRGLAVPVRDGDVAGARRADRGAARTTCGPTDVMQVNISSRATASVQLDVASLPAGPRRRPDARPGAAGRGARLADRRRGDDARPPSRATSPSCWSPPAGAVSVRATSRCAGSTSAARCSRRAWPPPPGRPSACRWSTTSFGMTEVLPVTGRTCSRRHLHHDLNIGLVEFLDLDTGEPAGPRRAGDAW